MTKIIRKDQTVIVHLFVIETKSESPWLNVFIHSLITFPQTQYTVYLTYVE